MAPGMTRRGFLAGTPAAAFVVAGAAQPAWAQPCVVQKSFKMKLGYMTWVTPDKTQDELIALAKIHGYQGIEFRPECNHKHGVELSMPKAERQQMRKRFADDGIEISAVSPGVRFCNDDRDQQLETMHQYIDLAVDIGAPCIRFFADPLPKDPDERSESHKIQAEYQARSATRAWEAGVLLVLETHSNSIGVDAGEMMHLAGYPPALRVNWHLGHCLRHGEDTDTAYRHVKGRVAHAHFDFPEDPESMKAVERQFELLLYDGFDGYFSIEIIRKTDSTPELARHARIWNELKAKYSIDQA